MFEIRVTVSYLYLRYLLYALILNIFVHRKVFKFIIISFIEIITHICIEIHYYKLYLSCLYLALLYLYYTSVWYILCFSLTLNGGCFLHLSFIICFIRAIIYFYCNSWLYTLFKCTYSALFYSQYDNFGGIYVLH